MNLTITFLLICCAFFLALLDTSFFSALNVFGATVLSTYILALALSLSKENKILLNYSISAVLFFSIFSSLPVWLIVVVFLCLPYIIFYARKKYFPKISLFSSALFFAAGTLSSSVILTIYYGTWNIDGLATAVYFTLINSFLGVGIYYLLQKWERDFSRKEIKF